MGSEDSTKTHLDKAIKMIKEIDKTGSVEISNCVYLFSGDALFAEQKLCGDDTQPLTEYYAFIKREKEKRDQQEYLNQDFNTSPVWIKKVEYIEITSAQDLADYLVEANNL